MRQNQFLKHVGSEERRAALVNVLAAPQAIALLAVAKARLEKVDSYLACKMGTNDADWRQDSRWMLAQKEMLEDLIALPQAAREKLMAEEGAQK